MLNEKKMVMDAMKKEGKSMRPGDIARKAEIDKDDTGASFEVGYAHAVNKPTRIRSGK